MRAGNESRGDCRAIYQHLRAGNKIAARNGQSEVAQIGGGRRNTGEHWRGIHQRYGTSGILCESAALTAFTVTVLGEGSVAGAVYLPVESIVPSAAEPPAVPFTDQLTIVFVVPVTVPAKVREELARILAVVGATVTATAAGVGGSGEVEDFALETSLRTHSLPREATGQTSGSCCKYWPNELA